MAGRSKTNASEWFPGAAERDKRDRPAGLGGWGDRAAGTERGLGGKSDGLLKHCSGNPVLKAGD